MGLKGDYIMLDRSRAWMLVIAVNGHMMIRSMLPDKQGVLTLLILVYL